MKHLGVVVVTLIIVALIGVFAMYVYVFGFNNGRSPIRVSRNTRVLGITAANDLDYSFEVPEDITYEKETLLDDKLTEQLAEAKNTNNTFEIRISSLEVVNQVRQSNKIETLEDEGWMILPWSYAYTDSWLRLKFWEDRKPKTEAIVLCYRRFYGENHEKSCYNLHKLETGDEILFDNQVYKVKEVLVRSKDQDTLFEANGTEEFLKIITNSGPNMEPNQNTNYLVVIAQKEV